MRIDVILVVGLAAAVAISSGGAQAGGYGCETGECYTRIRQPDVYGQVDRPVVIEPGYTQVNHYPPAIMNRVRAIEVVPGGFDVRQQPAIYGTYTRTVMVSPSRTVHSHVAAVHKVVHTQEVVRPAKVRWEYSRDAHGRMVKCKVVVPAVTRTVARNLMVSPAHTVARVIPASYAQVQQPMLVQPARTHFSYNPPVVQYVNEPMVIRPATREVIRHAPVIGFERQTVLVRRGGYDWEPARRHW